MLSVVSESKPRKSLSTHAVETTGGTVRVGKSGGFTVSVLGFLIQSVFSP
jgi:hypothetical protein